jgi:MerR family transcriptional regulator, thiopeptide resistance regulator
MYTIQQFARLADVTVKALRHYERLKLVVPARTASRHRRYTTADFSRLERVLALRTFGLPLSTIRVVLDGDLQPLPARLTTLMDLRARVDRAIEALRTIAQDANAAEALDTFVHESAWLRWERLRQARATPAKRAPDRVGPSRLAIFRAIDAALGSDPDSQDTRQLIRQWHETMAPETREAVGRRAAWPAGMRVYIASLYDTTPDVWERVVAFAESRAEPATAPEKSPAALTSG